MVLLPASQPKRHLNAAEGYLMLEMHEQALRALSRIDPSERTTEKYFRLLGQAHQLAKQYQEALDAFQGAYDIDPENLTTLMGMAWCYKRTDQLPLAISVMEEAYHSHAEEPVILYNLSCYFALTGDKINALSWLGRSLRMEPDLIKLIEEEPDFDSLRSDKDFQFLVESAGDKTSQKS
ncbi:tetratricopeptide repeat protein [uncultured Gimesia sp.]|uniref:tetratricopeptide repeat protein n=1 Tax=uncultured Gimesia sp. TaxID=1678688 RepID=UPI0030D958A9|tara:strand:+ start:97372 stop:97908 length:537 start_codon:yes stop_codon:yes gene_type:complete